MSGRVEQSPWEGCTLVGTRELSPIPLERKALVSARAMRSIESVTLDVDLAREQDIEELRRIAQALQALHQLLLDALAKQRREIERLRGKPADLQLTLKMLEVLLSRAQAELWFDGASQPARSATRSAGAGGPGSGHR